MKILVVDDIKYNGILVVTELKRQGHHVEFVLSGLEALKLLADVKNSFDVVVTDLMMPQMDGIALFRNAQNLPQYKGNAFNRLPPFFLLTASSDINRLVEAKLAGFSDILLKPLDKFRLSESLENIDSQQEAFERTLGQTLESIREMIKQIKGRKDLEAAKTTAGYIQVMLDDLQQFVDYEEPYAD